MERNPLSLPEAEYADYREVDLHDGVTCRVRTAISRKEKKDAVIELVARGMIFDEELGICYETMDRDASDFYVIVKHYTDIDVDPYDSADGWIDLYDKLNGCGAMQSILSIARKDADTLRAIRRRMETAHKAMFERRHSLAYQIQHALSGVLTQPGQEKIVSEAREVNEFLIDALGLMAGRTVEGTPGKKHAVAGHPLLSFGKREIV